MIDYAAFCYDVKELDVRYPLFVLVWRFDFFLQLLNFRRELGNEKSFSSIDGADCFHCFRGN